MNFLKLPIVMIIFALVFIQSGYANDSCAVKYSYEISFNGPGGHSNSAYGNTNALHAAANVIEVLLKTDKIPEGVTYNIGSFFGGNSVNSIAGTATVIIDGCASSEVGVSEFGKILVTAIDAGISAENKFRGIKSGQVNDSGVRLDIRSTLTKK